ncbi:hypothetical protein [Bradyrhizobium liaoningense]
MGALLANLVIETSEGQITVVDELTYSFMSADNSRHYDTEICLDREDLSTVHGVRLDEKWSAAFAASGGRTSIHQRSAVEVHGRLYLAVGNRVVCLNLGTGSMGWSRRVDPGTCFGIHWDRSHEALISHGELQISRLSPAGDEIWSAGGADIFTGELRCLDRGIEVADFNRSMYLFDYRSGQLLAPR